MDTDAEPPSSSSLLIEIEDPAWESTVPELEAVCRRAVAAALRAALPEGRLEDAEISLLLTGDARMRALNTRHRGIDRPTNVLSFPAFDLVEGETPPARDGPVLLGDLALGRETVHAEATELGIPPVWHLSHLLVHGTLHLLGFDHDDDVRAARMEALEREVVEALGMGDPYARRAGAGR